MEEGEDDVQGFSSDSEMVEDVDGGSKAAGVASVGIGLDEV